MNSERRHAHRERPKELSYIQFEPGGGGIVLNASNQGLAFQASAALRRNGPIQLCVSPNPMAQIKLTAEIAWMDETQKSGGLRFTELRADARNQILQWLTQTSQSQTSAEEFTVSSCPLVEETDHRLFTGSLSLGNGTPHPLSSAADSAMLTGSHSANLVAPRIWGAPARLRLPPLISLGRQKPIPQPQLLIGLAIGSLILVLAFMTIFFSRAFRQEIGNSLVRIGEKLKGNHNAQPDRPSPMPMPMPIPVPESIPVQISKQTSVSPPSVANPVPASPAKESLDQVGPDASIQITQGTTDSATRSEDRQHSRQNTADARARRGRSARARQLWSALGAGDSSAEVPLAQLYLTGDGVPKNCEQARVLLRAAAKNGNIDALRQLRQLKTSSCR